MCVAQYVREDEVLSEQLTRNVQFFGEEPQQRIADAFVVVVGLGVSIVMTMYSCMSVWMDWRYGWLGSSMDKGPRVEVQR